MVIIQDMYLSKRAEREATTSGSDHGTNCGLQTTGVVSRPENKSGDQAKTPRFGGNTLRDRIDVVERKSAFHFGTC